MSEDMVTIPRSALEQGARIEMTAREFISDWRKGDFDLPKLAQYDAIALENALINSRPDSPQQTGDEG